MHARSAGRRYTALRASWNSGPLFSPRRVGANTNFQRKNFPFTAIECGNISLSFIDKRIGITQDCGRKATNLESNVTADGAIPQDLARGRAGLPSSSRDTRSRNQTRSSRARARSKRERYRISREINEDDGMRGRGEGKRGGKGGAQAEEIENEKGDRCDLLSEPAECGRTRGGRCARSAADSTSEKHVSIICTCKICRNI